jgi:hypothetical protein
MGACNETGREESNYEQAVACRAWIATVSRQVRATPRYKRQCRENQQNPFRSFAWRVIEIRNYCSQNRQQYPGDNADGRPQSVFASCESRHDALLFNIQARGTRRRDPRSEAGPAIPRCYSDLLLCLFM